MAEQINQGGAQVHGRQDPKQTGAHPGGVTQGEQAQHKRGPMSKMERAEDEMPRAFPGRDPALKKTGEF